MNMESPLQLAQLIGGISICLVSLLFAYFLSSKKFQYYSVIYKLSHVVLYMFNMQKLYNNITTMKQLELNQTFYFFIFGQVFSIKITTKSTFMKNKFKFIFDQDISNVSTIIFHLQLDSLWLELVSSIGQAIIILVILNFDVFQTNIIVFTYLQFSIFQVINIFKSQKKFLLKLNDKSWLSITDYFYQIPIVIIKFDSITQYISLNDCNKTSEKFFDFRGDDKDSDKLNKKMSQFILEDILQADDINYSQNITRLQFKSPAYSNNTNYIGNNIYSSQRDLKSYLINKSAKIIFQKDINLKSFEDTGNVEIIQCIYNNNLYEVQILPVVIDFQLSIALQFHQIELSQFYERKHAKTLEKSYNLNVTNMNTPTQFKSESVSKLPLFVTNSYNHKKQNLYLNTQVQNPISSISPISGISGLNIPQFQNMNQSSEYKEKDKQDENFQVINFYNGIISYMNRNIDDLIATFEYADQNIKNNSLKMQIQGLKIFKQEQKQIFDAVQLRVSFIKNQVNQQSISNQPNNSGSSNQVNEISPPTLNYHYFDFTDIYLSLKHYLLVHGYDYYFNVKNLIPSKFQIYSNKEAIQQIFQCCIFLIVESCKLKSMHVQQSNLMRSFSSNGAPIPQNIINQNVNDLINTLKFSYEEQKNQAISQTQTNAFQHKMMGIEFSQIITQNQTSNIAVKITNIQNQNIFDTQKHSKLASFFFSVLKTYLDKVGILTSLQQKQNDDNLRYNIYFTVLSDCNQIQQQRSSQVKQKNNAFVNQQTAMSSQYYNNSQSPKNVQFKEVINAPIDNQLLLSSSNKCKDHFYQDNPNSSNNSQINFLTKNKSESKFQFNSSLNNTQKQELYNFQEKIEEQVLNDTEDEEQQSEIVEQGNEYQNDQSKLDQIKQVGINSLVYNDQQYKKTFLATKNFKDTHSLNKFNTLKNKQL